MTIVLGLILGVVLALVYIFGIILCGFLIAMINKLFYRVLGRYAGKVCDITSIIGTPIHELGHALFCVIFGHKIVDIKLYRKDHPDGVLGYVNHTYNKKNIYNRIGLFFIGVGPIILGGLVLLGLQFLLSRNTFYTTLDLVEFLQTNIPVSFQEVFPYIGNALWLFISNFFTLDNVKNVLWWIYLLFCILIGTHMTLSKPDIQGSISGLLFALSVFILVPVIVSIFGGQALVGFFNFVFPGGVFMIGIYTMAVLMAIVNVILAIPLRLILNLFNRKK